MSVKYIVNKVEHNGISSGDTREEKTALKVEKVLKQIVANTITCN